MADYSFGGSEEENAELRKLEAELVSTSDLHPLMWHTLTSMYSSITGRRSR
jgi:hypothetical protein